MNENEIKVIENQENNVEVLNTDKFTDFKIIGDRYYYKYDGKEYSAYIYKEKNVGIDTTTQEDKKMVFAALDTKSKIAPNLNTCVDEKIKIVGFITKPFHKIDYDKNRYVTGAKVLLKSDEGNFYYTYSKNVYFSILKMYHTFCDDYGNLNEPIEIKVIGEEIKNEKTGFTFEKIDIVLA